MKKFVIVGSDPNSGVAALLLARAGRQVQLLTGPHVGGVTRLMGNAPMDARLAEDLGLELPTRKEGRLGVSPSGARVSLRREGLEGEVSAQDQQTWPAFVRLLDDAAELWRTASAEGPSAAVGPWRELGRRHALEVLRLPGNSLKGLLDECFESELLKATLASAALFGTRQGPFAAGTAFLLLQRWARNEVLAAQAAPLESLSEALLKAGVAIQRETASRFEIEDGKIVAVHTNGNRTFEADMVISSEDPVTTLGQRVGLRHLDPELGDAMKAWKTAGTTGTAEVDAAGFGDHAVVSLTDTVNSLEKAYDPSKYGESSSVPFGELEVANQRVWVQHLIGKGSEKAIDPFCKPYGVTALDKISPDGLERAFLTAGGHLYGGDPVLWQSLGLRDSFSQPLPNLRLCGPGVGRGDFSGLNGERQAREVLASLETAGV